MSSGIGDLLLRLGLTEHGPTYAEARIDLDVLPQLTEADLEKLGLPLGDRKRLLEAAARLRAAEGRGHRGWPTDTPGPAGQRPAKRRRLTVAFVDLVGSTAIAALLDPEETASLVRAYHGALPIRRGASAGTSPS